MENNNKEEKHPFISNKWLNNLKLENKPAEWIINENENFAYIPNINIESIILGSFPTFKVVNCNRHNNNKEFFYGSSRNDFWDILSYLSGINIISEKNYFEILASLNIGVTDIIKSACRCNNGSADKDLYNFKYNNFLQLKNDYFPNLKNIFFTSGGKGNIKKKDKNVASWFCDYFLNDNNNINKKDISDFYKKTGFEKNIINFNFITLYSPSNNNNISLKMILNKNKNFEIKNIDLKEFKTLQWLYLFYNKNVNLSQKIKLDYENNIINNDKLYNFFKN